MNKLWLWLLIGAAVIFAGLVYLGRKSTDTGDNTSSALKDFLGAATGGGGSSGGSSTSTNVSTAANPTPLEKAKSVSWAGLRYFWSNLLGATNSGTMDGDIDATLRAGWQLADVRDIGNDGTLDLVWFKGDERSVWTQAKNP